MQLEKKSFELPDETRSAEKGRADIVEIGGVLLARSTAEPGWRWSEHIKPTVGTESCEATHLGYVLSGRMKVVLDDGSELVVGPGDAVSIPPGHDAWVVGEEPCVTL